jgi:hypothetical protein
MTTAFTTKQPSEGYSISFDFTAVLGAETISSVTVTATDLATLDDATATILDAAKQTNTDQIVYAYVEGGTSGHNYLITCLIAGSLGSVFSLDGVLPVESSAGVAALAGGQNLNTLTNAIQDILQDSAYSNPKVESLINDAVTAIAAGIRMPDGSVSPPLPDLFTISTVTTVAGLAYASLPVNYQRGLANVYDSSGVRISHPRGGDYYSFNLFLRQANHKALMETGSVYMVCVKGTKLYYQGIPTAVATLGLHYYKKPTTMVTATDEPDGIPEHLQLRLIKHYVIMTIFGEQIESGVSEPAIGYKYHEKQFYTAMTDLIDFIGITDAAPTYYGGDDFEDLGACDG